ncbi:MAG: bifunctional riboflavin kinase/FAD synthetase [Deltaproteobacteria bacterium]|nr:bifunctional riboflavin kinase/FAD synthetase [Deltaproteobacteria bacterium]
MDVIKGSENLPVRLRGGYVTIGNFDGVHLGHQFIFRKLVDEARREKCPAIVISFDPHPKRVLHPERRPFYLITSLEEKTRLIESFGIDAFLLIPFSLEYAKISAAAFVNDILRERLEIRKIFIGHDYTFGRGKEGNGAFLTACGERLGFAVETIGAFRLGETTISSTKIRNALLAGEVRSAASLLGRPYNLAGTVVHGKRRGTDLGFPTANLAPDKEPLPPPGIYAVRVFTAGRRLDGVLNIGFNPTFAGEARTIEVHIFDFHEDIYGKPLELLFIERLREEIRFASVPELLAQIDRDIVRTREILAVES